MFKKPDIHNIYKPHSEKTDTERTLEQLEKIRLNRLKKQADEMAKTSPNSVERSRLMMNNIVEERKRATARAEGIRDTIRETQVGTALDYQRFRDATIPQGPPKPQVSPKKPEARSGLLQNIKTGAEYISGKGGAGIAAGIASAYDALASSAEGLKRAAIQPKYPSADAWRETAPKNQGEKLVTDTLKELSRAVNLYNEGKQEYLTGDKSQLDVAGKALQRVEDDFRYAGGEHNKGLDFLADTAYIMGRRAPTIYINTLMSALGAPSITRKVATAATTYGTASTMATKRALGEGASQDEAAAYSRLSGLIRGGGDYLLHGLFGTGSGMLDTAVQRLGINVFKNISNPIVRPIIRWAAGSLGEGVEAATLELLDVGAQKLTYKEDAKVDIKDLAYAGALGTLMGAIGSMPKMISDTATGINTVRYTKGIIDSVKNARTEQDFNNAEAYINMHMRVNEHILKSIVSDKALDSDNKASASAAYRWMQGELKKALDIMSTRRGEIIKENQRVTYEGTTADDVSSTVDFYQSENNSKEAIDTVVDAVKANNAIKNEATKDDSLSSTEKKNIIDNIDKANKGLTGTVNDIRNDQYEPKTEKPKTGLEESIDDYAEYLQPEPAPEQEAQIEKPQPAEVTPIDTKPAEVAPIDTKPVEATPVKIEPAEVAPVELETPKDEEVEAVVPKAEEPVQTKQPAVEPAKPEQAETSEVQSTGNTHKLISRILKLANKLPGENYHDTKYINGYTYVTDGVTGIRAKGTFNLPINEGEYVKIADVIDDAMSNDIELELPDLDELKKHIKFTKDKFKAEDIKDIVLYRFGKDLPTVDAEKLLSIMNNTKGLRAYAAKNRFATLYFTTEDNNTEIVLMPIKEHALTTPETQDKIEVKSDVSEGAEIQPVPEITIPDYNAIESVKKKPGETILATPLYDNAGNMNRAGRKINVKVEDPIGKYHVFSREEGDRDRLYISTPSGRLVSLERYFPTQWNDDLNKYVAYRPTEGQIDSFINKLAEVFEKQMSDPTMWADYDFAAILNKIEEADKHNELVRKLQAEKEELEKAEKQRILEEEDRQKEEKRLDRIDEIAKAIHEGNTITLDNDTKTYEDRSPILDLFRAYDINLPLRTQGWVKKSLSQIKKEGYSYRGNDSEVFMTYLTKLREAIENEPEKHLRSRQVLTDKQEQTGTETAPDEGTQEAPPSKDVSGVEPIETETAQQKQGDKKYNVSIVKEKHTKTGEDLIIARVDRHLENSEFKQLKELMKEAGAYYSIFAKGFIIKDPNDKAKLSAFVNILSDTTSDTVEQPTKTEAVTAPVPSSPTEPTAMPEETKAETGVTANTETSYASKANVAADIFANKLANGETITRTVVNDEVGKAFDGTLANNDFTIKDVNDAMELGVNKHILSMDISSPEYSVEGFTDLTSKLPTQTNRTADQQAFQQFSTPPALAYVAADTANITEGDTVMEPSAGIGGIAVFAKNQGAKVHVNELDPRRLSLLQQLPFDGFYNEDAEQIHNILGDKVKPSVVIMNPPFSSAATRNVKDGFIGAKHIEAALNLLEDGGRLVAIAGRGMNDTAPMFSKWWGDIKKKYNVRANIGLDGKNYYKYGTSFDVQLIVIDKDGATTGGVLTGTVKTVQELQNMLRSVKDARIILRELRGTDGVGQGIQPDGDQPEGVEVHDRGKDPIRAPVHVPPATPEVGAGTPVDNTKQPDSERVDGVHGGVVLRGGTAEPTAGEFSGTERQGGSDGKPGVAGHGGRDDIGSSGSSEIVGVRTVPGVGLLETPDQETATEAAKPKPKPKTKLSDNLYDDYEPQTLTVKGAKKHPAKISESAAMSAIKPPKLNYVPNISKEIIESGTLSDIQLEAISYAGQAHSQTLEDGTTRGFFIGDGTGLGKGREIAGIMLDNFNRGQTKALWVSENKGLLPDAKRDINALFGTDEHAFLYEGGQKAKKILTRPDGIMFVPYATLSSNYRKEATNLNNIAKWLGEDFDGVIAFDEAHKMANVSGQQGSRGKTNPSNTALAGVKLQKLLPKAKIVYSSATGATEVSNFLYAERLGLWGAGTPFLDGRDFVGQINASGIAAMEVVARSLKAMGVYTSRNLSYEDVEYTRATHTLTKEQKSVYNDLASAWRTIVQNIDKAIEITQGKGGAAYSTFWGTQQSFVNQIITSMQVPTLIENIEKDLANDKSILIQLTLTGEAHAKRELAAIEKRGGSLDEFDATPKAMVVDYLLKSFPVEQHETVTDENGNEITQPVLDSDGNKVLNKEAVAIRDELIRRVSSSLYPDSPLDMIVNHFGADMVAENTGRSFRMIKNADGNVTMQKLPSDKNADVKAFQDGKKRILIFSEAGGTGKSYHADRNSKNQQQRRHYLLQPGWKATTAMQGLGRGNRANQVSAPEIILMTTDIPGQKRFVSTIARRLDQLGALTKGQAQTASQGLFQANDNLENPLVGAVLENLYRYLATTNPKTIKDMGLASSLLDRSGNIKESTDLRDINKFLNRVLILDVDDQTKVFDQFEPMLDTAINDAIEAGVYNQGLANHDADRVTIVSSQDIETDAYGGQGVSYYHLKSYTKLIPLKYEQIDRSAGDHRGIYQSVKTGNVYAVYTAPDSTDKHGNVSKMNRAVDAANKRRTIAARTIENDKYYTRIAESQESKLWREAIDKLPDEIETDVHVIGGEILSIWDRLPDENVKIRRYLIDNGEQIIGRVIESNKIEDVLHRIGLTREKEALSLEKAMYALKHGGSIKLVNGWVINPVRVAGEMRYELDSTSLRGISAYRISELAKQYGFFTEQVGWNTRLFIPAGDKALSILERLTKYHPVNSIDYKNADELDAVDAYGVGEIKYSLQSGEASDADKHYAGLVSMAESRGIKVKTDDTLGDIKAYYNPTTNTVYMNTNAEGSHTALLGHELFHALPEKERAKMIHFFRTNSELNSEQFQKYKAERTAAYQEMYAKDKRKFSESDFWQEFGAENTETLFTNEEFVRKLAQADRSLIRRILDWIRNLWNRIIGLNSYTNTQATEAANISAQALSKAETMLSNALDTNSWNLSAQTVVSTPAESGADFMGYNGGYGDLYSIKPTEDITQPTDSQSPDIAPERTNEELDALFEKDRVKPEDGITRAARSVKSGATADKIAYIFRAIGEIPENGPEATRFAQFRHDMINYRYHPARASEHAIRIMNNMMEYQVAKNGKTKTKSLSHDEYKVYEKAVYYRDLKEEADYQMARGNDRILLPHGMTLSEVHKQLDSLDITENVQRALDKRSELWRQATNEYIEANAKVGFDVSERFTRRDYYRHQVIEYMNNKENARKLAIEINDKRGFLKMRAGSEKAINTNYISVEYTALRQILYDTYVAKTLGSIKENYDIKPELVAKAKEENKQAIDGIILQEAKQATIKDEEARLGRALTKAEIADVQPRFNVSKTGKLIPDSETYRNIAEFNKKMAWGLNELQTLANDGILDSLITEENFAPAIRALQDGDLNSDVFKFISALATSENESARNASLTFLKNGALKQRYIKNRLGDKYMTWEKLIEGTEYTVVQPRQGNHFFTKDMVAVEDVNEILHSVVLDMAKTGEAMGGDAKELIEQYTEHIKMMGQPYEQWVVPSLVKTVMDKTALKKPVNKAIQVYHKHVLGIWKWWVTGGNPFQTFKYGTRNFIGDLDAVIMGEPRILKYTKQALTEIYDAMRHRRETPSYTRWEELGGTMSTRFVQEVTDAQAKKLFTSLKASTNIMDVLTFIPKAYFKGTNAVHNFRESILRYSAYLYYLDKINKAGGKVTDFVASSPAIIKGLKSNETKAFQLSNDLLGNYIEISEAGRRLRSYAIPFWSFSEANFKRVSRMVLNPIAAMVHEEDKEIGKNVARWLLRAGKGLAMTLLLFLSNLILNKDNDDKLPESVRARPHLTLWSRGGNVYSFNRIGNLPELLEWVGLDDYKFEWKEDRWAPVDNLYSSLRPDAKAVVELISGLSRYPEVTKPKPIRDAGYYVADIWGLGSFYNEVTGKPTKGNMLDLITTSFVYKYDEKESAYRDIINAKYNFSESEDKHIYMPDAKSNHLYNMKLAIRYGETNKAYNFMEKYFESGGTGKGAASSLQRLNPEYGFLSDSAREKRNEFLDSLSDVDYEKWLVAKDYYQEYLAVPEGLASELRKLGDSPQDVNKAMIILANYIRTVTKRKR